MRQRLGLAMMAVFMTLSSLLVIPVARADSDVITIDDCEELQLIGDEDGYGLDDHYVLAGDIDCSDTYNWDESDGFEPIGPDYERAFTGLFDGAGHTISDLTVRRSGEMYIGLFGYVNNATIKNVNLTNATITGEAYVGSLLGTATGETLIQAVSVVNTAEDTGVFVNGDPDGGGYAGGLLGVLGSFSSIRNSFARTTVTSLGDTTSYVGGLVGLTTTIGDIENSYVVGVIEGATSSGSTGPMVGSLYYSTTVNETFWDSTVYGSTGSDDGIMADGNDGFGRPTSWLKTQSNLVDSAWNFDDIWAMDGTNDGYAHLQMPGGAPNADSDKNGDGTVDSAQEHVTPTTSTVTGKTVVLEVDDACSVDEVLMEAESGNVAQDAEYNYPQGLMDFTATCGTPGFTTTVKQYYYGVNLDTMSLRKYNPTTQQYAAISDATLEQQDIYGQSVIVAAYQVTDGGMLDADGVANGVIVDPAGLASPIVPGAPNTGFARQQNPALVATLALLTVSGITLLVRSRIQQ